MPSVFNFFLMILGQSLKAYFTLCFLIYFVIEYKKIVGGYISFKDTFSVTLGISVAGAFLATFFSILLFNFIDTDFAVQLKDFTVEKLVLQLDQLSRK